MAKTFQDQVGETGEKGGEWKDAGDLSQRQRTLAHLSGIGVNAQSLGEMAADALKMYFIVTPGHCPGHMKSIHHYEAVSLFLF